MGKLRSSFIDAHDWQAHTDDIQFNLSLPDVELHKAELQVFRTVSAIPPQPGPSSDSCGIPPLLIAFILDTSDIPNGQALMWNKHGRKVTIDMNSLGATTAKGKEREARTGIILERWTFRATSAQLLFHLAPG